MIDPSFLKEIESRGWIIEACDETSCIAKCRSTGCGMRLRLAPGKAIPLNIPDQGYVVDLAVESFDQVRQILRDRREGLTLSIQELEQASGLADDHILKFERDNWQDSGRMPNTETFIAWAQSLGYQVVLRPTSLPAITLGLISSTRHKYKSRRKRTATLRGRGS